MNARTSLTNRVLRRLQESELGEIDPWLRDDYRIAWITVLYASRGESHPHFWATYQVLRTSPDQVWSGIVRDRKAKLGHFYASMYDANGVWLGGDLELVAPPKKPAQSVAVAETRQRAKAAAA